MKKQEFKQSLFQLFDADIDSMAYEEKVQYIEKLVYDYINGIVILCGKSPTTQSIWPWVWKHRADIPLGRHAPKRHTGPAGNRRVHRADQTGVQAAGAQGLTPIRLEDTGMETSPEEIRFFDEKPQLIGLYAALRAQLARAYPEMGVRVGKTQISFLSPRVFAMASLPQRRGKSWPKEFLLVSFGLGYEKQHPRIAQATEPYPGRWTHHVPVQAIEEIDQTLMGWLAEAYAFSRAK